MRFERGHNFAKQVQMEERYPHQGIRVSSVHITVCMWDAAARLSWRGGDDDQKALALRSRALRASASAKRSDVTRKLGPVEWCKWRGSKGRYSLKLAPHPSLGPYGNVSSAKHPGGPRTEVNIAAARATNPRILTVTAVKMHCRILLGTGSQETKVGFPPCCCGTGDRTAAATSYRITRPLGLYLPT